jgi:hypothetical protein
MANLLEATFPGLVQGNYAVTSLRSKHYNCVAWAAGDSTKWWWPGANVDEEYWPESIDRLETLDSFQAVFASLGNTVCQRDDLEPGFEKVAIFATDELAPKHAALAKQRKLFFLETS